MIIFSQKEKGKILRRELFYFFASLFLVFSIMEIIFPRIILAYFNINYLLLLVVLLGVLILIKDDK
jgi:hypothetical protein